MLGVLSRDLHELFSKKLFFGTLLDVYLLIMKIYHGDLLDKALYAGP